MSEGTASLGEITRWLDERLHVAAFDEPGANGLLIDRPGEIALVAAAVTTSYAAIEAASRAGAQLLLTHHPAWERFDLEHAERKRALLRERGLAHYAAHSSLDGAPEISNSDGLARLAGVRVERRFLAYCGGQAGVVGACDGTFRQLVARLRESLGTEVQGWENTPRFGTVAVASGRADAAAAIAEAKELGADTYITGEGTMWTKLYARESGVNLVFGTHHLTETFGVRSLAALLERQFGIRTMFVDAEDDLH